MTEAVKTKEEIKAEKLVAKEAAKAQKLAEREAAKAEKAAAKKEPRKTMASAWGAAFAKAATDPSYTKAALQADMIAQFPEKEETVLKWTDWYKNFYNMGKIKGYENPVKVLWVSEVDEAKKAAKEQKKAEKLAAREAAKAQKLAEKEALKAQKAAEKAAQ